MKRMDAPPSAPRRDGIRWQSLGMGVASAGTPIGIGVLHPSVGVALMIVQLSLGLAVIGTALYGTQELSERAFRLLRWIGNRPEPARPEGLRRPRTPSRVSATDDRKSG